MNRRTDDLPNDPALAPQSGGGAAYDAESMQGRPGDTPVFERGRAADLDGRFDDEIGLPANPGFEGAGSHAPADDGRYGTGGSGGDPVLLGQMGMGIAGSVGDHGGFDDEDERGQPAAQGYDGDMGDPASADELSGSGASYGAGATTDAVGEDGPLLGEFGVGSGFANPEEPGFSNDEDSLLDSAEADRAAGGGAEIPPGPPGVDVPPPLQPGYDDDGADVEVPVPPSPGPDMPDPMPRPVPPVGPR